MVGGCGLGWGGAVVRVGGGLVLLVGVVSAAGGVRVLDCGRRSVEGLGGRGGFGAGCEALCSSRRPTKLWHLLGRNRPRKLNLLRLLYNLLRLNELRWPLLNSSSGHHGHAARSAVLSVGAGYLLLHYYLLLHSELLLFH